MPGGKLPRRDTELPQCAGQPRDAAFHLREGVAAPAANGGHVVGAAGGQAVEGLGELHGGLLGGGAANVVAGQGLRP